MRLTITTAVAALALAVSSCASVAAQPMADGSDAATPSNNSPMVTNSLGSSFMWDDGLQAATSKPVRWAPSAWAVGHTAGNQAIKFTVALTNGSREAFDPALTSVSLTYGADGQEAEAIFDTSNKVNGPTFSQTLLPGKRATVIAAFDVPPTGLGDLQVQVSPNVVTHDPAIFTGSVK